LGLAERYTEEADQAGLAEDAVIKLEGHKANRVYPNHFRRFGKRTEKQKKIKVKADALALPRGIEPLFQP